MPGAFADPGEGAFASEHDSFPPESAQPISNHFFSVFNSPSQNPKYQLQEISSCKSSYSNK